MAPRKTATKTRAKSANKAESAVEEVVAEVEGLAKELEGKTVEELRVLHTDALVEESEAKRYLYQLQQRARNAATDAGPEIEHELIKAKEAVAAGAEKIKAIEKALEGEFKDLTGIKFGDRV